MTTVAKINAVTFGDLRDAADRPSLDAALAVIMPIAGIETGDVAGAVLAEASHDHWRCRSSTHRLRMLTNWLEAELVYAEPELTVGHHVRLTETVDLFPDVIAEKGWTGTVEQMDQESVWVKLDCVCPTLEEWDNQLQIWRSNYPDGLPLEVLQDPAKRAEVRAAVLAAKAMAWTVKGVRS
jgi:hypothetical protein